jgi:type VI secretion system Hcp family effector
MRRRWRVITVTAVAALGGATAVAVAAVPDGNDEVHACLDVTTTTGGVTVPNQSAPNLTIIDPSAGQRCIPPDGPVPSQTAITWNVTGPQGPPGVPGAQGAAGATGPTSAAGATGSAGAAASGVTNSVTIAPPLLTANAKPVGDVTIGSGGGALTFSVLAADQAGVAARQPGTGKTTFHEFSFTKKLDKASPDLFRWAASGKHIPKLTIEYAQPSVAGKYLEIKLSDVLISSDQTQASAGNQTSPHETVSLTYSTIKWTYTQQKPDGIKSAGPDS